MENQGRAQRRRRLRLRNLFTIFGWFVFFVSLPLKLYYLPIHRKHGDGPKITVKEEGDVYHHSLEVFEWDYADMELNFKIYVYPTYDDDNDDQPMHSNGAKGGCAWYFFKNLVESSFMTYDPNEAHSFFVPLSNHKMIQQDPEFLGKTYVSYIISTYPYWNRSLGSDHFFITCDKIDVRAIKNIPLLIKNSTRLVCCPSYKKSNGNNDVSIPSDIQPYKGQMESNLIGSMLIKSLGYSLEDDKSYFDVYVLRNGKYCVCLGNGSIPTSNCIVGAIHYGCVPVILLSDYYDLPLGDVLDWRKFAVVVADDQVPLLRTILKAKSGEEYEILNQNLLKVRRHFEWNSHAVSYDAFHMALYNLWLRRKDEVF